MGQQFEQYPARGFRFREESCIRTIPSTWHRKSSHLRGPYGSHSHEVPAYERGDRSGPAPWYGIAVSLAVPRSHVYSSSVNCAHERLGILRLSCKSAELRCRAATSINT